MAVLSALAAAIENGDRTNARPDALTVAFAPRGLRQ
jgi:hypothetical protein